VDTDPHSPPAPPAVVAQLLATEHWSLLATRGTMWSEVMSRITILLTVLTGSLAGLILAMNRLRAAYAELAPGIEEQFVTSTRSDERGLMQTYSLGVRRHTLVHIVGSTNFFVGTVNTLVAGALAALVAATAEATTGVVVTVGVLAAVAYFAIFVYAGFRTFGVRQRMLREN
jgi:hypothetical protein